MRALVLALIFGWSALAYAADPSQPHILVAKPELRDQLAAEIKQGAWYVLEPDAESAMREPQGLWEELVQRSAVKSKAI